ncbi:MAG: hypothetical protein EA341_18945 [Mongoliibacter sp.]|nr:MAG: hypothetical protein EA341_18945 [Mongoliibacter sp.]
MYFVDEAIRMVRAFTFKLFEFLWDPKVGEIFESLAVKLYEILSMAIKLVWMRPIFVCFLFPSPYHFCNLVRYSLPLKK